MKRFMLFAMLLAIGVSFATAQPKQTLVRVNVSPDHSDWNYTCGEKPKFDVAVVTNSCPIPGVEIYYEISEDKMPPFKKGTMTLKDGTATITGYTMKKPGFMRCRVWTKVNGYKYEECATAGFDIDRIEPTTVMPDDFEEFWAKAIEANRKIEMLPELTLVPEKCTSKVNVYSASFQSFRKGSRIYGTLCVPVEIKGKCPAILIVPGAGCRSRKGFYDEAEKGFVTFEIGIHGIPTVLKDESLYSDLKNGSLLNYQLAGIDDKDGYFYKRVFVGCARAIDFLASMGFVDENMIGVTGGSQGGALSITTAYLNPKVKCAAAFYPAMCDIAARIHGQSSGWPNVFTSGKDTLSEERLETIKYYDVVNFARKLTVPVFFSYGYNDMTCCPTSVTGAYNVITSPKSRMIVQQSRHYTFPEQWKARSKWMMENVVKQAPAAN